MKLLVDLQAVQTPSSAKRGIGRYSLNLTKAISNFHDVDLWIALNGLYPDAVSMIKNEFLNSDVSFSRFLYPTNNFKNSVKVIERLVQYHYSQIQANILHICSVFEDSFSAIIPKAIFNMPLIRSATLHDLIPLIFREDYFFGYKKLNEETYLAKVEVLKRFDLLLANSEASRQDAINLLNFNPDNIFNVAGAVDDFFKPILIDHDEKLFFLKKYELKEKFILYTGGIDFRKNIPGLIKAYSQIDPSIRKNHQLIIVCACLPNQKQQMMRYANQCNLQTDEIILTGYVSDKDLVYFYNLCTLFVFPSLYEGFGLPVLEAMACGAPVIASNISSIPEIINFKDALFNEKNIDDIARVLQKALIDKGFRNTLIQHGLARSKDFSWDNSAKLAIDAFTEVLNRQKPRLTKTIDVNIPKKKIAFFSPMPPQMSGIASYSDELLKYLTNYYDIDVYVSNALVINGNGKIYNCNQFDKKHDQYHAIVYQLGNSYLHFYMYEFLKKYPGIVVLHDFFLSDSMQKFFVKDRDFENIVSYSHGQSVVELLKKTGQVEVVCRDYPLNKFILDSAKGLVLHSDFNVSLLKKYYGNKVRVPATVIPHLREVKTISPELKLEASKALNFKEDDFIISSFGHISQFKLNELIIDAYLNSKLAKIASVKLIFVGPFDGIYIKTLKNKLKNIVAKNIILTDTVSSADYEKFLRITNFAVQLRTRTRGETSGALLDCMSAKLPVIVNSHGTFQDYPNDVLYKISECPSLHELSMVLEEFYDNADKRNFFANNAYEYVKKFNNPYEIAAKYNSAIEEFVYNYQGKDKKLLLNELGKLLGSTDINDEDLKQIAQCAIYNSHLESF